MRCVLFYFSGTGNTWWCATTFCRLLTEKGCPSQAVSIEQVTATTTARLAATADLVALAWPVYGSDLPQPMKDFMANDLPPNQNSQRRALLFCSQLAFSGDGAMVAAPELAAKGWEVDWALHVNMPNNLCIPGSPFPFSNDPKHILPYLKRAKKRLTWLASMVIIGKPWRQGAGWFSRGLGLLQRLPYQKAFGKRRDYLAIDNARCTACGRCWRLCPANNIRPVASSYQLDNKCTFCMRCYNYCPVQAVLFEGKSHQVRRGAPYHGPEKTFQPESLRPETTDIK